ncbi:MAG: hypothetical protein RLZZ76_746 [Candidatus Parcubacteria bacterium]
MHSAVLDGLEHLVLRPAVVAVRRIAHLFGLADQLEEAGFLLQIGERERLVVVIFPDVATFDEFDPRFFGAGRTSFHETNVVERPGRAVVTMLVHVMVVNTADDHLLLTPFVVREPNPHLVLFPELGFRQVAELNLFGAKHAVGTTQGGVATLLLVFVDHFDRPVARDDAAVLEPDRHRTFTVIDAGLMHKNRYARFVDDGIVEATDDTLGAVRDVLVGVRPCTTFGVDLEDNLVADLQKFGKCHCYLQFGWECACSELQ